MFDRSVQTQKKKKESNVYCCNLSISMNVNYVQTCRATNSLLWDNILRNNKNIARNTPKRKEISQLVNAQFIKSQKQYV